MEDFKSDTVNGLARRASMLEVENESLRVALRNLVLDTVWYAAGHGKFDGKVSGTHLDAARRLAQRETAGAPNPESSEKLVPGLRWVKSYSTDGSGKKLQQCWLITVYRDGRPCDYWNEWRDVPFGQEATSSLTSNKRGAE